MKKRLILVNICDIWKGIHLLLQNLGPALPKKLIGPSIIESAQKSILLIGGFYPGNQPTNYDSDPIGPAWETSIHKLQCALGKCSWNKLNQELQTGRHDFVAVPIHDAWTTCRPGEKVSKTIYGPPPSISDIAAPGGDAYDYSEFLNSDA